MLRAYPIGLSAGQVGSLSQFDDGRAHGELRGREIILLIPEAVPLQIGGEGFRKEDEAGSAKGHVQLHGLKAESYKEVGESIPSLKSISS